MKKAFTLLELVFIIIIVGIITTIMISDSKPTKIQEAATQLLSDIRYTQHLAMIDDKFNSGDSVWYRKRWQLIFQTSATHTDSKLVYSIFSDSGTNTSNVLPNNSELAIDPSNHSGYLSGGTQSLYSTDNRANKKMNLGLSYDIVSYSLKGGCRNSRLSFDNLGRPISGTLGKYTSSYKISTTTSSPKLINKLCVITLNSLNEGSISIHIEPETGYTYIPQ